MYTYRCQNTKHVQVPLSEHKTCTRTTLTVERMYPYHNCYTLHVRAPISEYQIVTRTVRHRKYKYLLSGYMSFSMSRWFAGSKQKRSAN